MEPTNTLLKKRGVGRSAPLNMPGLSGKLPPQALEVEQAVLGALMLEKEALSQVIDLLHPDVFYVEKNRWVFEAVRLLFEKSEPVDLLTVTQELKSMGRLEEVGGAFYIADLTNRVSSSANIDYHARILLEKYILRELIHLSGDMSTEAFDDTTDVFELLDRCETKLFGIADRNIRRNGDGIHDLVQKAFKQIQAVSQQADGLSGIPSGFTELDRLTSGWQRGSLNIIAARPGMGKTAFTLSMARNMAIDYGKPVAFFSLEMSSVQLITRLISSETGLSSEKLRTGKLEKHEWEQLSIKVKDLEKAPLFIDDTPSLSIFDLRAKARRLASQHGIKLIVVDYLQLMTAGGKAGGNREQEISMIPRNLKALAKELEVPVIALSQLSRAVETRGGSKRPLLSDLRESGAIEQDADIVSFIYRPEYYKIDEWDDEQHTPSEGQAEFIIAKHRNGGLENIRLKFIAHLGKFDNLDDFDSPFDTEFHSKMNAAANDNTFKTDNFTASPEDAFDAPDDEDN